MKKYIILTALSMCATLSAMNISDNTIVHLAPPHVLYEGLKKSNREDFTKKTDFHLYLGSRKYSVKELDELSGSYIAEYNTKLTEQSFARERKYITQVVIFRSIAYAQHKKFVHTARPLKETNSKL